MATADTREKIVDTALKLFSTRGPKSVTMDEIAGALHISKRTLYEHFATKEELLTCCLTQVRERTDQMHRQAHARAGEPMLIAMYMLRSNALFIQKYRRIIEETERYYPEIHERFFQEQTSRMRDALAKGLDYAKGMGYFRPDIDLELAAEFFMTVIRYRKLSELNDIDQYTHKMNEVCFTYLRGMMNTATLERYDREEDRYAALLAEVRPDYDSEHHND